MLKGIDPLLDPDLLRTLAAMGHGDTIVVADRNFPSTSHGARVHYLGGARAPEAVAAICSLMPLDEYVDEPLQAMEVPGQDGVLTEVQRGVVAAAAAAGETVAPLGFVGRFAFYDLARAAFAVVATGEDRPYGCFLLTKGVVA